MGANTSSITTPTKLTSNSSQPKNEDLVVRDHTYDYDLSGIEYLKAHEIPQLFQDLTERLLSERPLDSLRFLRNILIHKVIQQQDYKHRTSKSPRSAPNSAKSKNQSINDDIPKLKYNNAYSFDLHKNKDNNIETSTYPTNLTHDDIQSDDILLTTTSAHYDADKLLVSRTTKRTRSYSDSAIIFDQQQLNYNSNNLNELSKPIDIGPYKKNNQYNVVQNDTNVNINIDNEEKKDQLIIDVKSQIGDIANKFQNKLKSLSNSAKSIPSKLKNQIQQDNNNNNNNNNNDNDSNQSLRRSKTMELLIESPPFRHILSLSQTPCFGFDIGGSLTKISFFEPSRNSRWGVHDKIKAKFVTSSTKYGDSGIRDKKLSFPWRNGTFHFIHFQTHRMNEAVSMFKTENLLQKNEIFYATGGGAHKYSKFLTNELSVRVKKGDELQCLISGLNFLLNHVPDECYYLSDPASKKPSPKISWNIKKEGSVFPYLLVNCGSGVSILKVDSPTQFERVSGTQIGGGTYWGLCRLCSYSVLKENNNNKNDDCTSPETLTFKKAFELAMKGNAKKVNMLVSDIYGGDYPQCNLPGDLVASAFGKCISIKDPSQSLSMGDIARGLLDVIAMNCAQLAYLNAVRFKITRIIFAGNFLRQNDLSMAMISYAIHYWSQGVMKACFLKHEGYFGSIGVMLLPDKELINDDDNNDVDGDNDNQDIMTTIEETQ